MDINRVKAIDIIRVPLLVVLFFSFTSSASATLEITDFFSDYTSSEVTHDMDVARQTDRIITMRDGMIARDTGVKGNEEHGL